MIPETLGPYRVLAKLGEGGMGEVFRAKDTRLGRDVALKVLPSTYASDPDRIARFRREAQVLASLNHPHIAAIYGLEEADGVRALVLELVEGETLAERVAQGAVALDEALAIGRQIAEALEAAHEQGIVHRDLKPANIKVNPDGKVKVLDFGLAKLTESATAASDPSALSMSPTITSPALMTNAGMILGTAAYMSPEQAKGRPADKRSDVWAFGCVLYELLTGQRAIDGDDVGEVLAAVIKADVSWSRASAIPHAAVQTLLRRCLRKDPRQRLGDGGAVRLELDEIISGAAPAGNEDAVAPRQRRPNIVGWSALAAALLLVVAAGGYGWLRPDPPADAGPIYRLTIPPPVGTELMPGPTAVISPDGTKVVFVASIKGIPHLHVRAVDAFDVRLLPDTARAQNPFFAPDGTSVGFFADSQLKIVSLANGVVRPIAPSRVVATGTWGETGRIVFTGREGLEIIRADGSGSAAAIPNTGRGTRVATPSFLPVDAAVLVSSAKGAIDSSDDRSVEVLTLATGERRVLVQNGTAPQYLPTGHLVFLRRGAVMAVPFDLARMAVTRTPVEVVKDVRTNFAGLGTFSCSATGTCLYVPGSTVSERMLVLVDRSGVARPLPVAAKNYSRPTFSPTGDRILYQLEQSRCDIEFLDLTLNRSTKLTTEGDNHFPVWSADGQRVAYISTRNTAGAYNVVVQSAAGTRESQALAGSSPVAPTTALSWSRDGTIAYSDDADIWTIAPGDAKPKPFAASRFSEASPAFSPDGQWLAYTSDESGGSRDVYVERFPGGGDKIRVSEGGGTAPVWAPNGRELFFKQGDQLLAVDVDTRITGFSAGRPRLVLSGVYASSDGRQDFDVSPDGQTFLMLQPTNESERAPRRINVVVNWFSELQRLVSTK